MPSVYSYLRFSNPEQLKGDSQRRQVERSAAWASRNGHTFDSSLDLRDLGISAFRGKNAKQGSLGLFLECIENGKVKPGDYLVLENLDRLTRNAVFEEALPLVQRIIRAGVSIVTLDPERVYSRETVKDIGSLIEMLVILYRANDESATKSSRLKAAWGNKRNRAADRKLTTLAPKWLKPLFGEDPIIGGNGEGRRTPVLGFEPIPERVEVVKRIFQMAADGFGVEATAKALNREQVPTFGRSGFWQRSYVAKILANRAVLGEFQPHRMEDGKRIPSGEPIADYFPSIITEAEFYSAQRRAEGKQQGRHASRVSNLFMGLLRDARDGSSMVFINKQSKGNTGKAGQISLVSSAAVAAKAGSEYVGFPYAAFEQALLVWASDLRLSDILPRKARNIDAAIRETEGMLSDLSHRIATLEAKMLSADNFDALIDWKLKLESERSVAQAKLDRLKMEGATTDESTIGQLSQLLNALNTSPTEQVYALRLKLRTVIKRLVKDIVVLVVKVNNNRLAIADIELRNGTRRCVTISANGIMPIPQEIDGLDVRNWKQWPKHCRKVRFDVVTDSLHEMMDLDDAGVPRTEIAERLGVSPTQVSRTLKRFGRVKLARKAVDSEQLMTWHPGGRGWVKRLNGKRYFVGLGTLAKTYPRMVKERTKEGSIKAANRWWQETLKSEQLADA